MSSSDDRLRARSNPGRARLGRRGMDEILERDGGWFPITIATRMGVDSRREV